MGYGDALIYGLVEGVTEFLPISSTGHLVLAKEVIAPDAEEEREEGGRGRGRLEERIST